MNWNLEPLFVAHKGKIDYLAAKDYCCHNGVWDRNEDGSEKHPFDGRLPDIEAMDVDALKGAATQEHEKFRTCDALIFAAGSNPPCLTEFKDQGVRNIIQKELMEKCWGSLVVLHKTLLKKHKFQEVAKGLRLIVVYSSSKSDIIRFMAMKAGMPKDEFGHTICWDLDYYSQVGLFTSVHSWTDAEFNGHRGELGI